MAKNYPLVCLNVAIAGQKVKQNGLRPLKEITSNIQQAIIDVRKNNPEEEYDGINEEDQEKLGKSA